MMDYTDHSLNPEVGQAYLSGIMWEPMTVTELTVMTHDCFQIDI